MTSSCRKTTGFGSGYCNASLDRKRGRQFSEESTNTHCIFKYTLLDVIVSTQKIEELSSGGDLPIGPSVWTCHFSDLPTSCQVVPHSEARMVMKRYTIFLLHCPLLSRSQFTDCSMQVIYQS